MRWAMLLTGLLFVAGAPAAVSAPAPTPPLTPDGWGPLRIGMSEAEAVRRFGLVVNQADGEDCHVLDVPGRTDLTVMTRQGRVASLITVGPSRLRTDRGLGIGAREADIWRAYGRRLTVEPNSYEDPPAHYLTFWVRPGVRGVMYVTDSHSRVTVIHVGDETIGWTDGCG